jgi:type I restriction enzyme, S subunit
VSIKVVPFLDVFEDESGGNVKTPQSEYLLAGRFPVVDQGKTLIAGYVDDEARLCGDGRPAIVFGDHTRCVKYAGFPFCMGADGVKVLRPKIDANLKYLYYFLNQLEIPNAGYDRHYKYLKRTEIVLQSLPEQRRIAAILDQADALRAKRRETLTQLNSLTQSIFIEMFGEALGSSTRFALSHYIEEFRYGTSNKSGVDGYPALRIPNVTSGSLNLTELKTVEVDDAEFQRLKLRDGDLLFVRTNGNPDNVGRCAVFNPLKVSDSGFDSSEFIYASYLIRARMKKDTVLPVVLQQYLSSGEGRQALRARSKTSAGQFNINTEGLGTLPIPSFPMPQQEAFIDRKQAIEHQQTVQRSSLAEVDTLFASLQHRAFQGEL